MNKVVRNQVRRRIGTIQGRSAAACFVANAREIVFVEGLHLAA